MAQCSHAHAFGVDAAIIAVLSQRGPTLPSDLNSMIDPYRLISPQPSAHVWRLIDEKRVLWQVDRRIALPEVGE